MCTVQVYSTQEMSFKTVLKVYQQRHVYRLTVISWL